MPGNEDVRNDTERQIVDAAYDAVAVHGIARLSLADVAKRAGLSRQTLYRYFPSKDDLLDAVVAREEERFRDRIRVAVDGTGEPVEAVRAALATTLEAVRCHPLVERLLETEPETLVPYLAIGSLPGPDTARHLTRLLIDLVPDLAPDEARRVADVLSRLIASYVLDPFDEPPAEFAAWFTDLLFAGMTRERTPEGAR
ncbi:MAG: TetR/AcrR family transcriptional regulator [Acidimicrobiales bacterium]|nr:TetR/AcrR family transcriptional regulator [Acidimicrobiales bacterium]MCB1017951.1 TetR/AcrR family transcriptional regulator [Acidimicrobiales bacterium]